MGHARFLSTSTPIDHCAAHVYDVLRLVVKTGPT